MHIFPARYFLRFFVRPFIIFLFLVILNSGFKIIDSSALAFSDTTFFIHQDHLGSVIAVSDEGGNLVQQSKFQPYGSLAMEQLNNGAIGETVVTERSYTGQVHDSTTSLQYYNARYYDSAISRFISADSVQGGNRFAYVNGNPVMRNDPSGNSIAEINDEEEALATNIFVKAYNPEDKKAVALAQSLNPVGKEVIEKYGKYLPEGVQFQIVLVYPGSKLYSEMSALGWGGAAPAAHENLAKSLPSVAEYADKCGNTCFFLQSTSSTSPRLASHELTHVAGALANPYTPEQEISMEEYYNTFTGWLEGTAERSVAQNDVGRGRYVNARSSYTKVREYIKETAATIEGDSFQNTLSVRRQMREDFTKAELGDIDSYRRIQAIIGEEEWNKMFKWK